MGDLTNTQYDEFLKALLAAYDEASFEQMLRLRLDKRLDLLVKNANFEHQVFQVIDKAEKQGWTFKLLLAARSYNPGNARLLAFANQFGLVATGTPATKSALESIIQTSNSFLDAAIFRARQGWVETAVCRVKVGGQPVGTGFLVGPDVVMTNQHVVAQAIGAHVSPAAVTCQFDYKRLANGRELSTGVEFEVADGDQWLIVATPPTGEERSDKEKTVLPTPAELDFALLRLKEAAGTVELGSDVPDVAGATSAATPRAWLAFKTDHDFTPDSPLWIVQHPKKAPLKLALATNAVIGVNANRTRVTYRTNTDNGSSGSPVFDQDWNLVALHHMGDPDWMNPEQNEGIPLASIESYLRDQNLLDQLGEQEP